jgi:aminoglycoside phosphotransferase (APT) family kinase protein
MGDDSLTGPGSVEAAAAAVSSERSLRVWRRLDWRFLLRQLPAGVLLYQAAVPQDLAEALRLLEMDEAHPVEADAWQALPDARAGLVVLRDPSASDLRQAVRVLHPSGSVYVEIGPRSLRTSGPRTTSSVRRTLRAAGLSEVRPYWHAPDHAGSARIVPLDQSEAVRSTLMRYEGVHFGHLKSVLGRLALRLGLFPLAVSHGSVVGWRGGEAEESMDFVHRILEAAFGPDERSRHGLGADAAVVLLTPGFPTSRHVIGLVQDGCAEARLVVKLPRRPFDNAGVSREASVMRDLVARAPALRLAVPEVVTLVDEREHRVLVETAVGGLVLDPAQVQSDPAGAVRAGVDFVEKLPVTRGASSDGGSWFERVVEVPLERFGQHLAGALPDGASLVRRTRTELAGLAAARLPLVFEHGDLSHPNLFLHPEGGLRVIDWERSTPDGLVGLDLVFYLQYVAESQQSAYARSAQLAVLRQVFLEPGGWGRALLVDHLRTRDVDPALAPEILLATWARTACTLVERLLPVIPGATPVELSASELATVPEDRDVALWRCVLEYIEDARGSGGLSVR